MKRLTLVCAFLLIAFAAFWPALNAPFDFDDLPAIAQNQSIRHLWPLAIPLTPPGLGTAASGRPIANLTFALNYAVNAWLGTAQTPATPSPNETLGYHIADVLLHVANALLLFLVVRFTVQRYDARQSHPEERDEGSPSSQGRSKTLGKAIPYVARAPQGMLRFARDDGRLAEERIAILAAAIWLVHPIQTEAVNYVSQRTELLVSFFYLATLYCGIRALDGPRWWHALAIAASIAGMGSKEVMLTAPLIVILYDRAFLFDSWRAMWKSRSRRRFYAALVATSGLSIFLIATGGRAKTVGFGLGTAWYEYLYSQAWAISHYLRLVLWPNQLIYDYGQAPVQDLSGIPGAIALSALALATLCAWRRPQYHWLAFLGTWFFLLLAPSSSVLPIRTEIAAERRIYLALAAVIVLGVVVLERASPLLRRRRAFAYGAGVLLYGGMIAATFERSSLYGTPELLWRDAARKRPNNARAFNSIAVAELHREPDSLAGPDTLLARAIELDSTFLPALQNRAVIAIHLGHLSDAERFLRRALQIEPGDSAATEQLGTVLVARGQPEHGASYLAQVVKAFPNAKSLTELGTAYLTAGHLDSAIVALHRATELDSTRVDALNYLGAALVEGGRGGDAVPYLLRSVNRDSGTGFSLGLLCVAYGQAHQAELAVKVAAAAVAREPKDAAIYLFAGRGLQAAGRFSDAAKYLAEAVRLNPRDPQALTRLGIAEASLGKTDDARRLIRDALAIAPGYSLAIHAFEVLTHSAP